MPACVLAALGRLEQVGERQRRAQVGLAAAVLGRVVVALEHAGLVVAHPRDHLRVGQVLALHDDVDLARHAGRLLQRVEVAHAAQILRHQLAQVGVDAGLRVEREPGQREHEPDQQHALRPLERAAQRGLARAAAEPPQRREQAPHARAQLVDELGRPARRGAEPPAAPAPPRGRRQRRGARAEGEEERDRDAHHQQHAEAAHHRHRRQQQHEEADARGQRRGGDRRHRDARGAQRVAVLLLHPRLVLDRVVDPQARAAPAAPRSRPSSATPRAATSART